MTVYVYDTREAWLNAGVDLLRNIFADKAGIDLPFNIRVSVGYAPNSRVTAKSEVIGCLIRPEASADGHNEIFISPVNADDAKLLDVLTHELIHSVTVPGHGRDFGRIARALGLEGKLTATYGGPDWFAWATDIMAQLGPCPYASIDLTKGQPKKTRVTYTRKLECPACGWLARVTLKHIQPHTHLDCPVPDCDAVLLDMTDMEEGEPEEA